MVKLLTPWEKETSWAHDHLQPAFHKQNAEHQQQPLPWFLNHWRGCTCLHACQRKWQTYVQKSVYIGYWHICLLCCWCLRRIVSVFGDVVLSFVDTPMVLYADFCHYQFTSQNELFQYFSVVALVWLEFPWFDVFVLLPISETLKNSGLRNLSICQMLKKLTTSHFLHLPISTFWNLDGNLWGKGLSIISPSVGKALKVLSIILTITGRGNNPHHAISFYIIYNL